MVCKILNDLALFASTRSTPPPLTHCLGTWSTINKVIFGESASLMQDCSSAQGSQMQKRMNYSGMWGSLSSEAAGREERAGIIDSICVHSAPRLLF